MVKHQFVWIKLQNKHSVYTRPLQAFSSNGQPAMEFKDRRLDFLADSATGLMFYDIQDVVDAYKCAGRFPVKYCESFVRCILLSWFTY